MGSITDTRTQLSDADAISTWVGSTSPAFDDEIFIEGIGSIAESLTNSVRYVMFDNLSAIGLGTDELVWVWINCGIVGLLETKANGGMRIRFAGGTITDFFEVYVGGNDDWPTSIEGGWSLFCVNVTDARAAAITNGWTGGTAPSVANVEHIGYAAICTVMPRNADNTWIDSIWYGPADSTHFTILGDNGGADWTFADINTQLTNSAGLFLPGPAGSWVLNGKMGIETDGTFGTTDFLDSNQLILFGDFEYVGDSDFGVRIEATTASDIINLTLGIKTGTGDDATGAQGVTFQADAAGARPEFTIEPNATAHTLNLNFYGCTFTHLASTILSDHLYTTTTCTFDIEMISDTFIDCSELIIGEEGNNTSWTMLYLRGSVIDANTADGVAFMFTNDLTDIRFSSFEFSDGHAVGLSATLFTTGIPATMTSKGNTFTGYGAIASTDAALYNQAEKLITVNVTDDGDSPSYRNVSTEAGPIASNTRVDNFAAGAATTIAATLPAAQTTGQGVLVFTRYDGNSGACTGVIDGGSLNALELIVSTYDATVNTTLDCWFFGAFPQKGFSQDTWTATFPASVSNRGIFITGLSRDWDAGFDLTDFDAFAQTNPGTGTDAVTTATLDAGATYADQGGYWGVAVSNETGVLSSGTLYSNMADMWPTNSALVGFDNSVGIGVTQPVTWTSSSATADFHGIGVGMLSPESSTVVNNAVTVTVSGVTEGVPCKVIADETVGTITKGDLLGEDLSDSSGEFSFNINYESAFDPSGLDVIVRARQQGLPNFAIHEDNAVFTDQTTAANSAADDDMTLVIASPVAGQDYYYFGYSEQFPRIKLDVSTVGTGTYTGNWEYFNGTIWTALSGVTDGTDDFKNAGANIVEYTLPGNWAKTTVGGFGPTYYVRWAYASGTVTIAPTGRKCQLDVTRYLPFVQSRTIESTGLTVVANWTVDSIAKFDPND